MELTPLTFGVEIETVCLWSLPRSLNPEPGHVDKLAPALQLPRPEWNYNAQEARRQMQELVRSIDVPEGVDPSLGENEAEDGQHYLDWTFKGDTSINEPSARRAGYEGFEGIEITSPIMWATEESFQYVNRVFRALTGKFRLRINQTTGLHVHVGRGTKRNFSQQELRYFGAMIWSAEHVLDTLQPPERRSNHYSMCVRSFSNLARGAFAEDDDFGGYYVGKALNSTASSETSLGDDRYERSRLEIRVSRPQETASQSLEESVGEAFRLSRARTQMPGPDPDNDENHLYRRRKSATFGMPPLNEPRPAIFVDSAREGSRRLLDCRDRRDVATLLCWRDDRLAWNFETWSRGGDRHRFMYAKMTVECRAGHGSVNPSWIATWAQIVVGLAAFAIDAPRVKYFEVLDRLAKAEEDDGRFVVDDGDKPRRKKLSERPPLPTYSDLGSDDDLEYAWRVREEVLYGVSAEDEEEEEEEESEVKDRKKKEIKKPCTYDVIDFLQDIGLFGEAMYVEKYLLKDPDKFWYPHHPVLQRDGGGLSLARVSRDGGPSSDSDPSSGSSWEPAFLPRAIPPESPPRAEPKPAQPPETVTKTEGRSDAPPPRSSVQTRSDRPPIADYDPADWDPADLYDNSDDDRVSPLPPRTARVAAETSRDGHAGDAAVVPSNPTTEQGEVPESSSTAQNEDMKNPSTTQNEALDKSGDHEGVSSMPTGGL